MPSKLLNAAASETSESTRSFPNRYFLVAALLLLAVAAVLRFYHVGGRSLWFDEALTADISRGTWTEALEGTRSEGSVPVIHPYLLYLIEKATDAPTSVRFPSVLASLLAVAMMLAMVRVNVSQEASLFAAAILTVSPSQIRYAQEAREYSFSVLFAALLIFCLLKWKTNSAKARHPFLLYGVLFIAPFVQYGLVLLALAVLSTVGLRLLLTRNTCFRLSHAVIASCFLGAGGLLSFFLTLRYQLGVRQFQLYLAANYFDPKTMSLLGFLSINSHSLLSFFIPGRVITLCLAIAAVVYCIAQARTRKFEPVTLLVFTSVLLTMCAAVTRVYPYGGIRQCLFLAPVLTLFAGVAIADLFERLQGFRRPVAILGFMALIFFSGYRGILRAWPYGEVEDTQSVLKELLRLRAPDDQVYVYSGARPAVDFYLPRKDHGLIYGKFHREAPQEYVPELLALIDRHTDRIWLVFSHVYGSEEQEIVDCLRPNWDVQRVVTATGAALFLAHRRASPVLHRQGDEKRGDLYTTQSFLLAFLSSPLNRSSHQ